MNGMVRLGSSPPRPLDVDAIEEDLSVLWKDARGEETRVVRACHATLVVAGPEEEIPLQEFLDEITALHPSRILVAREAPGLAAREVRAWVSASCSRRSGDVLICSESVHLDAGPGADRILASVVRSLTVGGLPAAVVVRGRSPLEPGWIVELGSGLDLVMGDSEGLDPDAGRAFRRRCAAGDATPFRDLAWHRLRPWRRALAAVLDGEDGHSRADALRAVEVEGKGPHDPRALLLAAWMAGALGEDRVTRPRPGEGLAVALRFEDGRTELRSGPPGTGILRDGTAAAAAGGVPSDARAVVEELRRPGSDPRFPQAARRAVEWEGAS